MKNYSAFEMELQALYLKYREDSDGMRVYLYNKGKNIYSTGDLCSGCLIEVISSDDTMSAHNHDFSTDKVN